MAHTYDLKNQLKGNNLIWNHYIPENDVADAKLKDLIDKMKGIDKSCFGGDKEKTAALGLFSQMCADNARTSRAHADQVA